MTVDKVTADAIRVRLYRPSAHRWGRMLPLRMAVLRLVASAWVTNRDLQLKCDIPQFVSIPQCRVEMRRAAWRETGDV
jgi:hypothetical protein